MFKRSSLYSIASLTCLNASKIVLSSVLSLIKRVCRTFGKTTAKDAKGPIPVDVRGSKTSFFKFPIDRFFSLFL